MAILKKNYLRIMECTIIAVGFIGAGLFLSRLFLCPYPLKAVL